MGYFFLRAGTKCSLSVDRSQSCQSTNQKAPRSAPSNRGRGYWRWAGPRLAALGETRTRSACNSWLCSRAAERPDGRKQPESLPCGGRGRRRGSHVREGHPGEWRLVSWAQLRLHTLRWFSNPQLGRQCLAATSCLCSLLAFTILLGIACSMSNHLLWIVQNSGGERKVQR